MAKKENRVSEKMGVKGFFKIQINEDGKVVGDSGWNQNQITNEGFNQYLGKSLAGMPDAKQVAFALLGTGTAPGATATTLDGEITDAANVRCAVSPTMVNSKTVQFAFTLSSNVYTESKVIANVGLINHSSTSQAGTIFAGNTFASSQLQTNQGVFGFYEVRFNES